jgi:putative oxidoreductase
MKKIREKLVSLGNKSQDLALLLLRLVLAYGFFGPAIMKWENMTAIGDWFKSLGYPFPYLNAYLAGTTELLGVILLILGFGTRIITLLLIFVMFIAITTVHLKHGFEAGNNGFEIPLYYAVMLFALFAFGPGKYSLEAIFCKKDED